MAETSNRPVQLKVTSNPNETEPMNSATNPQGKPARPVYRCLALLIGILLFGVALPASFMETRQGGWLPWFFVVCSVYAGTGMLIGAWTGSWPGGRNG